MFYGPKRKKKQAHARLHGRNGIVPYYCYYCCARVQSRKRASLNAGKGRTNNNGKDRELFVRTVSMVLSRAGLRALLSRDSECHDVLTPISSLSNMWMHARSTVTMARSTKYGMRVIVNESSPPNTLQQRPPPPNQQR